MPLVLFTTKGTTFHLKFSISSKSTYRNAVWILFSYLIRHCFTPVFDIEAAWIKINQKQSLSTFSQIIEAYRVDKWTLQKYYLQLGQKS